MARSVLTEKESDIIEEQEKQIEQWCTENLFATAARKLENVNKDKHMSETGGSTPREHCYEKVGNFTQAI